MATAACSSVQSKWSTCRCRLVDAYDATPVLSPVAQVPCPIVLQCDEVLLSHLARFASLAGGDSRGSSVVDSKLEAAATEAKGEEALPVPLYVKELELSPMALVLTAKPFGSSELEGLAKYRVVDKVPAAVLNVDEVHRACLLLSATHRALPGSHQTQRPRHFGLANDAERVGVEGGAALRVEWGHLGAPPRGGCACAGRPCRAAGGHRRRRQVRRACPCWPSLVCRRTFFHEPYEGALKSPKSFGLGLARGTAGLLGGVAGGVLDSVGKVSGSGGAAFVRLAEGRTEMLESLRRQHEHHAADGVRALGSGMLRGVTGVVMDPFRGAREQGVWGFVKGVGSGLGGVVLRPVAGVLQFVSIETEAAGSALGSLAGRHAGITAQVRPRRSLQAGGAVHVYDAQAAAAQHVLQVSLGHGHACELLWHAMVAPQGESMLLLTRTLVLLVKPHSNSWKVQAPLACLVVAVRGTSALLSHRRRFGNSTSRRSPALRTMLPQARWFWCRTMRQHRPCTSGHCLRVQVARWSRALCSGCGCRDLRSRSCRCRTRSAPRESDEQTTSAH